MKHKKEMHSIPVPFISGKLSKLSKKMESDGIEAGGLNLPASNAIEPDINEIKVILEAKRFVEIERSIRTDAFISVEKKISESRQKIEEIENSIDSMLSHDVLDGVFAATLSKHDQNLVMACCKEMESGAALNRFKAVNKIYDPANYPEDQLFHFSLLILFVVLETAVNAFFYKGSTGLIGGAFVALAIAVVNMGIAASLGAAYRYKNLINVIDKCKGYISLLAFIIFGVVLNLIFSTFRVQYELLQDKVLNENIPEPTIAMLISAFRVAVFDAFGVFVFRFPEIDVMSFILFFLGVLCSLIAFWKGYTYDDKHPGYGKIDRIHKRHVKEFEQIKRFAFEDSIATVQKIADDVGNSRDSLIAAQKGSVALKAQIKNAESNFSGNVRKIQGELELLIEAYRGANRAVRKTNVPIYFSNLPNVTPGSIDDQIGGIIGSIDMLTDQAKKIADEKVPLLSDSLHQMRSRINELVQSSYQKYLLTISKKATEAISSSGRKNLFEVSDL